MDTDGSDRTGVEHRERKRSTGSETLDGTEACFVPESIRWD